MADLVYADLGSDEILKVYWNNDRPAGGNNHTLKLFTNNYSPVQGSVEGSFTWATGGVGETPKTLTNGNWVITTANDPSDAIYAEQTFTFSGALTGNPTIYGYGVLDADNVLIYAQLLPAPFTPASGAVLKVTPKNQASSGTPS